jgi:hypothetical protein
MIAVDRTPDHQRSDRQEQGGDSVSSFTAAEREYLTGATGGRRLAHVATVGADGTPHVVPVGFSLNPRRT